MVSLAVVNHHHHQPVPPNLTKLMTFPTISFKLLPPSHHFRRSLFRLYAAVSTPVSAPSKPTRNGTKKVSTAPKKLKNEVKLNWTDSLSTPVSAPSKPTRNGTKRVSPAPKKLKKEVNNELKLTDTLSTPVSTPSKPTRNGTKRVSTAPKRLKKEVNSELKLNLTDSPSTPVSAPSKPARNGTKGVSTAPKKLDKEVIKELKLNWTDSLSGALLHNSNRSDAGNAEPGWAFGIDPDLSGALAVLKPDNSPQVFDTPHLKTLISNRVRRRLDARLITQLLQTIDAPVGTTAYVEQSTPFPKDGKQGWLSVGFGYGLWIGILVASGYTVVPVPPNLWKKEFNLSRACKDDSRELASTLFPSMSSLLLRKKDHGRAEALLIAAYGKWLKTSRILDDDIPNNHDLQVPEHCELEEALSFSSSLL